MKFLTRDLIIAASLVMPLVGCGTAEDDSDNKPSGNLVARITPDAISDVYVNQSIQLNALTSQAASEDTPIIDYQWQSGDQSAKGEFVEFTYSVAGEKVVTLTITDESGATDTDSINFTVLDEDTDLEPPALSASISLSQSVINVGDSVNLSATTNAQAPAKYTWKVNGAIVGAAQQTAYTFTTAGSYTIELTVEDKDGERLTVSKEITVSSVVVTPDPLNVVLSPSATQNITQGQSLSFSASGSSGENPLTFAWSTGETSASITRTFNNVGSEQVCVTVTDAAAQQAKRCVGVNVTATTPEPEPEPTSTIVYYQGDFTNIYYWKMSPELAALAWPGTAMEDIGEGWKRYDFGQIMQSGNIIFNGGGQTGDLTFNAAKPCFQNNVWVDMNACEIQDRQPPEVESTPEAGRYAESALSVSLTAIDRDPNPTIYYTIDGSTPTTASMVYNGAISISDKGAGVDATIKAMAIDNEGNQSEPFIFEYQLNEDVIAPVVSHNPAPGQFDDPISVSLSASDDVDGNVALYYTLDGQVATAQSTRYSSPIYIDQTTTINVYAVDSAGNVTHESLRYRIGDTASRTDFREETVYFLLPTRFYDGAPENNIHNWDDAKAGNPASDPAWRGDFDGLIEKLDYIKALGFSAIWITPPVKNLSGYDYHGYHAVNMREIDPRYDSNGNGSAMDEYQKLIDAIHAKDMKLIQDIVVNHSGNFGEENLFPMFTQDGTGSYTDLHSPVANPNSVYFDGDKLVANDFLNGVASGNYAGLTPQLQYNQRINAMKEDSNDTQHIYHHEKQLSWNSYLTQSGQIAGDCVDLNTENPEVIQYLIDTYNMYIDMGVDGFRVDTVKHVPRLMFNEYFIPAFKERGGENFYIVGETAARYHGRWNEGVPAISPSFYTWKENKEWATGDMATNTESVKAHFAHYANDYTPPVNGTPNHKLKGNDYHVPDWSLRSGLDAIDFPMHWAFANAHQAFGVAKGQDDDYNDATWNMTYVDSHDYAPDTAPENQRFAGTQDTWAENLALMFTFRGIPTIYYGSEIEFQKGMVIDVGPNRPLAETGRAYFGDHLEGSVTATDFGEYTASGTVKETLEYPLAQHIIALNKIRRAVPALQKGQYSTEGVNGGLAFKRRFTDSTVDSFVLVTISGDATFSGIPNGTYIDAVTGQSYQANGGNLSVSVSGKGNMRVLVLDLPNGPAPGKVSDQGPYLN